MATASFMKIGGMLDHLARTIAAGTQLCMNGCTITCIWTSSGKRQSVGLPYACHHAIFTASKIACFHCYIWEFVSMAAYARLRAVALLLDFDECLRFAWWLLICNCACGSFSLGRFNKLIAMALVFLISAIVHEQIIACAMGTLPSDLSRCDCVC
jgi:hypothetical protein